MNWYRAGINRVRLYKYLVLGRKPWTDGYCEYKKGELNRIITDGAILDIFYRCLQLPKRYGFRLDERAVEYPWVISRLAPSVGLLIDAGSALNHHYVLDHPVLKKRTVVVYNLEPEGSVQRGNVSYIYGDIRNTLLKSECADDVVCISTLEHIGMNNTFLYSKNPRFNEAQHDDYLYAIKELKRLLKPGGKLLITVPFGRYQELGWLQQFDYPRIQAMACAFGASEYKVSYYKYENDGWQLADADRCADCSYFDIHSSSYEQDYVAAARAVACLELLKSPTHTIGE